MGTPLESSWELRKWILALLMPSLGPKERTLHQFLTCSVVAETFPCQHAHYGVLIIETLILVASPGSCSAEITSASHFLHAGSSPSHSATHMEHAQGKLIQQSREWDAHCPPPPARRAGNTREGPNPGPAVCYPVCNPARSLVTTAMSPQWPC